MEEIIFIRNYHGKEEKHRIVYIEYHDGFPFNIVTDTFDGYQNNWDIEKDPRQWAALMYYNSGSGGRITQLQGSHISEEYSGVTFWVHPKAKFKKKYPPINCSKLDNPIVLEYAGQKTTNPFEIGREVWDTVYCKFCENYHDENLCDEHHVINDEGEIEYMDGSKIDD